jgi:predicted DNA-binding transcriptional regulator YafY
MRSDSAAVRAHSNNGRWQVDAHLSVAYLSFEIDEARSLATRLLAVADEAEVAQAAADAAREAIEASREQAPFATVTADAEPVA